MRYITRVILCCIISLGSISHAQDLSFVNYTTKDGLSSSQVYQMYQDVDGNMLFATDRGITKYDGYNFETFDLSDGLTNTTVFKFFPQSNGDIWCSTIDNSWFYFKDGTTDFKACDFNDIIQKASIGGQPEHLWIDNNEDYYFSFEDLPGFLKINRRSKIIEQDVYLIPHSYDSLAARFMKIDNSHWFRYLHATNRQDYNWGERESVTIVKNLGVLGYKKTEEINGHFLFSSANDLIIQNPKGEQNNLKLDSKILGIGKFDANHFWISLFGGGVQIYTMSGNMTQHWLDGKECTSLYVDQDDGVWVSTLSNGVFYAQSNRLMFHSELNTEYVYSISPNPDSQPMFTTLDDYYVYENNSINKLDLEIKDYFRLALYDFQSKKYRTWIPKEEILGEKLLLTNSTIIDFSEISNRPLLLVSPYKVIVKNGELFSAIRTETRNTAIEYAKGGYLVGGYNGLEFLNSSDESFNDINHPALRGRISDIKLQGKHHFIGTTGAGLVRYNQNEGEIIQIMKSNGLASNLVNEVYAESESTVWVATNFGLDKVTFKGNDYTIKHFGIEDGLIDNDVTDVYIHNDLIWIGTRSGLCSITKDDFERRKSAVSLHLKWSSALLNGNNLILSNALEFDHDQNSLELNFQSVFFGVKNRIEYRYRIIGSNAGWHVLNDRKIIMNGLPPGQYKVVLQANVDDTGWRKNRIALNFTILPPFYQTWWFRTLIALGIAALFYLFFRLRVLIFNKILVREVLRLIIRKLTPRANEFTIKEQGKAYRIKSSDVLYLKSEGNYLTIQLKDKKHVIRHKISEFDLLVPDKIEYLRIHKSYIIRVDKITGKNNDSIYIDSIEIPIGKTYKKELKKLNI